MKPVILGRLQCAALVVALAATGCASYQLTSQPGQKIDVKAARGLVERGLAYDPADRRPPWITVRGGTLQNQPIREVKALSDRLNVTATNGQTVTIRYEGVWPEGMDDDKQCCNLICASDA